MSARVVIGALRDNLQTWRAAKPIYTLPKAIPSPIIQAIWAPETSVHESSFCWDCPCDSASSAENLLRKQNEE